MLRTGCHPWPAVAGRGREPSPSAGVRMADAEGTTMGTKKLIATMVCLCLLIALVALLVVPQPMGQYALITRDTEFTVVVIDQETGEPLPGVAIQFFQDFRPLFGEA